jgi:N,N-dimethylformamidase
MIPRLESRGRLAAVAALAALALQQAGAQAPADLQSNQQLIAQELQKRGIAGYADRLTVQQGQTIRFMVSSELPAYRADIVRMVMGDADSLGPGIKETVVSAPVNREYAGKRQGFPFGSTSGA